MNALIQGPQNVQFLLPQSSTPALQQCKLQELTLLLTYDAQEQEKSSPRKRIVFRAYVMRSRKEAGIGSNARLHYDHNDQHEISYFDKNTV